jgi:terminase small subunit / prophage DNA-packing protein
MADLLGVTRGTISRWLEVEGCPFESRPDVPGGSWELDAPAVVRWFADREVRNAVEKLTDREADANLEAELDPSMVSIDEAKRRKAVADARIREIDLDKAAGSVVPIADITEIISREYAAVREGMLGLGPSVAPRIVGQTEAGVIAATIRARVDEILANLQSDKEPRV